jgi:hypothetical protein
MSLSPQMTQVISSNRRALAAKLVEWELATAAVVCSVTDTRSGQVRLNAIQLKVISVDLNIIWPSSSLQRLLSSVLPLAVMVYLFPSRFHARAITRETYMPGTAAHTLRCKQKTWMHKMYSGLKHLGEELCLWLRGLYLVTLFSPAILSAPLVFLWGVGGAAGRQLWMDLILWTIERAGEEALRDQERSSTSSKLDPPPLMLYMGELRVLQPIHLICNFS